MGIENPVGDDPFYNPDCYRTFSIYNNYGKVENLKQKSEILKILEKNLGFREVKDRFY
jgi:hypothetical protein